MNPDDIRSDEEVQAMIDEIMEPGEPLGDGFDRGFFAGQVLALNWVLGGHPELLGAHDFCSYMEAIAAWRVRDFVTVEAAE